MRIGIKIMPREVILDSQGRAVEQSMRTNGFTEIQECRIGKFVEMNLTTEDKTQAKQQVERMLKEGGLYNPLIEKFEIILN